MRSSTHYVDDTSTRLSVRCSKHRVDKTSSSQLSSTHGVDHNNTQLSSAHGVDRNSSWLSTTHCVDNTTNSTQLSSTHRVDDTISTRLSNSNTHYYVDETIISPAGDNPKTRYDERKSRRPRPAPRTSALYGNATTNVIAAKPAARSTTATTTAASSRDNRDSEEGDNGRRAAAGPFTSEAEQRNKCIDSVYIIGKPPTSERPDSNHHRRSRRVSGPLSDENTASSDWTVASSDWADSGNGGGCGGDGGARRKVRQSGSSGIFGLYCARVLRETQNQDQVVPRGRTLTRHRPGAEHRSVVQGSGQTVTPHRANTEHSSGAVESVEVRIGETGICSQNPEPHLRHHPHHHHLQNHSTSQTAVVDSAKDRHGETVTRHRCAEHPTTVSDSVDDGHGERVTCCPNHEHHQNDRVSLTGVGYVGAENRSGGTLTRHPSTAHRTTVVRSGGDRRSEIVACSQNHSNFQIALDDSVEDWNGEAVTCNPVLVSSTSQTSLQVREAGRNGLTVERGLGGREEGRGEGREEKLGGSEEGREPALCHSSERPDYSCAPCMCSVRPTNHRAGMTGRDQSEADIASFHVSPPPCITAAVADPASSTRKKKKKKKKKNDGFPESPQPAPFCFPSSGRDSAGDEPIAPDSSRLSAHQHTMPHGVSNGVPETITSENSDIPAAHRRGWNPSHAAVQDTASASSDAACASQQPADHSSSLSVVEGQAVAENDVKQRKKRRRRTKRTLVDTSQGAVCCCSPGGGGGGGGGGGVLLPSTSSPCQGCWSPSGASPPPQQHQQQQQQQQQQHHEPDSGLDSSSQSSIHSAGSSIHSAGSSPLPPLDYHHHHYQQLQQQQQQTDSRSSSAERLRICSSPNFVYDPDVVNEMPFYFTEPPLEDFPSPREMVLPDWVLHDSLSGEERGEGEDGEEEDEGELWGDWPEEEEEEEGEDHDASVAELEVRDTECDAVSSRVGRVEQSSEDGLDKLVGRTSAAGGVMCLPVLGEAESGLAVTSRADEVTEDLDGVSDIATCLTSSSDGNTDESEIDYDAYLPAHVLMHVKRDLVSVLMEYGQTREVKVTFQDMERSGPHHASRFHTAAIVDTETFPIGSGSSKKNAKKAAAAHALKIMYERGRRNLEMCNEMAHKKLRTMTQEEVGSHAHRVVLVSRHVLDTAEETQFINYSKDKIAATFVLEYHGKMRVVGMGTGNRCILYQHMTLDGQRVIHSHAEIMARRAFLRYLYKQLLTYSGSRSHPIFTRSETGKLKVRDKIQVHLYISRPPCGDAAAFPTISNFPNKMRAIRKQGQLRTIIDDGEGAIPTDFPVPAGANGKERLRIMTCSDKICRWNVLVVQGALLSHFLDPIYINSLVIGSHTGDQRGHVPRAVSGRLKCGRLHEVIQRPFRINSPDIHYPHDDLADNYNITKSKQYCITWSYGDADAEILDAITGLTNMESLEEVVPSRVSKVCLFSLFREVCQRYGRSDLAALDYLRAKKSANTFQRMKSFVGQHLAAMGFGQWYSLQETS
ncbi:uncharacterized protein LOC101845013, partial [Aplysia californica]|uniref:Uncharacterized protein LOC101845013 n=1 Tax=Aplysia californica TaxID=6500 RepID=A0ABM1VW90_APLCA